MPGLGLGWGVSATSSSCFNDGCTVAAGGGLSGKRLEASFLRLVRHSVTERLSSNPLEPLGPEADPESDNDGCAIADGLRCSSFFCFFGICPRMLVTYLVE